MKKDDLYQCAEVLGTVAQSMLNLHEEKADALRASAALILAQNYVVKLASGLDEGLDPYQALCACARGTIQMPGGAASVFALLAAKSKTA